MHVKTAALKWIWPSSVWLIYTVFNAYIKAQWRIETFKHTRSLFSAVLWREMETIAQLWLKMKQHWSGVTESVENRRGTKRKHSSLFVEKMGKRKSMMILRKGRESQKGPCQSKSLSRRGYSPACQKGEQAFQTWILSTIALNPVQKIMAICSLNVIFLQEMRHKLNAGCLQCTTAKATLSVQIHFCGMTEAWKRSTD